MSLQYRADIDGLRAIAVLAVLCFHLDITGFTGGFVGVDVFFVISGFLITSIILKEIRRDNKFSVVRFYERRIRRIFPALFPVMTFTLVVGAYLFDHIAFKDLGQSITATTLFASNILFWQESGYFAAPAEHKPLLHTWSLAVEEQFYILFPLMLVVINRFFRNQYFPWLLAAGLISFSTNIWEVYNDTSAAFYFMHNRAWELLAGSILALGVIPKLQSKFLRNLLSALGFGLIFYSIGFYTESTLFPGYNAIAPVLGTCLIIYSGMNGSSSINKMLGWKPLVFIGLISYSLYLWHWPLIVFPKYMMFSRALTNFEIAGIILATFVISTVSWRFIEQPFRGKQPVIAERKMLFALSALVMVVAIGIGGVIHLQKGMPYRLGIEKNPGWTLNGEPDIFAEEIKNGVLPTQIGTGNIKPSFVLWGDSHAISLIPAVSEKAKQYGVSGYLMTHDSTPPLLDIDTINDPSNNVPRFTEEVLSFIKAHPEIKTVILAARWAFYINGNGYKQEIIQEVVLKDTSSNHTASQPNSLLLKAGLRRTVKALLGMRRQVVLVSQLPAIGYDVPRLYWVSHQTGVDYHEFIPTISEYNERNRDAQKILNELADNPNVMLISPESLLFDQTGRVMIVADNKILYRDDDHLSIAGAYFVAHAFDDMFDKMVDLQ